MELELAGVDDIRTLGTVIDLDALPQVGAIEGLAICALGGAEVELDIFRRTEIPLATGLKPRNFHGRITNGHVVVVENDLDAINRRRHLTRSEPASDSEVITLLFDFGLFSSGRGEVDRLERVVTYFRKSPYTLRPDSRHSQSAVSRLISNDSHTQAIINRLNDSAAATHLRVQQYGLQHPYRGGVERRRSEH